jgi:hypothetical protein
MQRGKGRTYTVPFDERCCVQPSGSSDEKSCSTIDIMFSSWGSCTPMAAANSSRPSDMNGDAVDAMEVQWGLRNRGVGVISTSTPQK